MGKTMEVYIDDMLVNSKGRPDHVKHLQDLLRRYDMKLCPLKCVFGVSSGKFLDGNPERDRGQSCLA